jgi:tRNA wybutosine-synthesizing protein 3
MNFDNEKTMCLNKLDQSKKGEIDKDILPLVNKINSLDDYYTTSTCSGRILLMYVPEDFKKNQVKWLFSSHNTIKYLDIKKTIDNSKEEDIWFRQESAIIHIACKDINTASKLIEIAKQCGFKRSGIQAASKRIILELVSTELIYLPIKKYNQLLVDEDYIKIIINEANKSLLRTKQKIKKLTSSLQ